MNKNLQLILNKFWTELKKDILFFGGCGSVVAIFFIWQSHLKERGISKNPHWATDLFSDFLSLNAFSLIFFGYMLLASIANIFAGLGFPLKKLEDTVFHMEARLTQIASSIIAFSLGLLFLVVIYSILNLDSGGIKLIFMALLLLVFILSSLTMALIVGYRTEPYDKWWVSIISTIILSCIFGWLIIQSDK